MNNFPKQSIANLVILALVAYLAISLFQLHAPYSLSAAETNTNKPSARAVSVSEARRARPMPACAASNTPAKTFLMVFMGHSGSSAILSELRGHSQVYMEVAELVDHQPVENTTAALISTREFFDRGIAKGKIPGFKIRPRHILNAPDEWSALAAEYDTHIIWQYRQNIVKAGIGEFTHRYLNDSSVVEGLRSNLSLQERCEIGAGCRFNISNFTFLHSIFAGMMRSQNTIARAVHAISKHSGCVREVPYEDYLYDRQQAMTDLRTFLRLPHQNSVPLRFKATGDNLCQVVRNWNELCSNFYGCLLWQHMLNDERNNCFCQLSNGPSKFCTFEKS